MRIDLDGSGSVQPNVGNYKYWFCSANGEKRSFAEIIMYGVLFMCVCMCERVQHLFLAIRLA